jgi:hypothetical protein
MFGKLLLTMLVFPKPKLSSQLGIRLDEHTHEMLSALADAYGISASDLGRHALYAMMPRWQKHGITLTPTRRLRGTASAADSAERGGAL